MSKKDKKRLIAALAVILASTQFGGSFVYAQNDLRMLTDEELLRLHNDVNQNRENEIDSQQNDATMEYDQIDGTLQENEEQKNTEDLTDKDSVQEPEKEDMTSAPMPLKPAIKVEDKENAENVENTENADTTLPLIPLESATLVEDVVDGVEAIADVRAGEAVVGTANEFFQALRDTSVTKIIVTKNITVVDGGSDMDLAPIKIRGGVTITGQDDSVSLVFRGPIQLTGDHVTFKDIELNFISSDAMGGVPHREIFLAGHSLTFDNVRCYTAGANGSLGGFGSSESELLPEVYAGGYRGTTLGSYAQFTVTNANDKTMLKAIYTGHSAGQNGMVPYDGQVTLSLDPKTIVREGIFAGENKSNVNVTFKGTGSTTLRGNAKVVGNAHTTVVFDGVSAQEVKVDNVENIELKNRSLYEPKPGETGAVIKNITVSDGTILNLNSMNGTEIKGNFNGGGTLILNTNDTLRIDGDITGETKFQTWGGTTNTVGRLLEKTPYVISQNTNEQGKDKFVLSSGYQNYEVLYENNRWSVQSTLDNTQREFGSMEIVSGPDHVSAQRLDNDRYQYVIKCKDKNGVEYYPEVFAATVRADILKSLKANQNDTDWLSGMQIVDTGNGVYDFSNWGPTAKAGEYVVLFMLEDISPDTRPDFTLDLLLEKEKARASVTVHDTPSQGAIDITNNNDIKVNDITPQKYTGKQLTPEVIVTMNGTPLIEGTDFIVTYEENVAITTNKKAVANIEGIGKYTGIFTKEFDIVKGQAELGLSVDNETNTYTYGDKITFTFTAQPKKPSRRLEYSVQKDEVEFIYNDQVLGKSYVTNGQATFVYDTKSNIIKPGEAKISVRYGGSDQLESTNANEKVTITLNKFSIKQENIKNVKLQDFVYDGQTKETQITGIVWQDAVQKILNGVYVTGKGVVNGVNAGAYDKADMQDLEIAGENAQWYELSNTSYTQVPASVNILKAEAPDTIHDTQVIALNSQQMTHDIDFSAYLPSGFTTTTITVDKNGIENEKVLDGTPIIEKNHLKFTRKTGQGKQEFSIPIKVSFTNYEDMIIRYHFIVTDATEVDLQLQAPDKVYSGTGYNSWSVQNAKKEDLMVAFYNVTTNKKLDNPPTDAGKYRIEVKLSKDKKIGEASKEFAITPMEIKLTAISQTIRVDEMPMDLNNPQLGTHYRANIDGVDGKWGPVTMWYSKTLDTTKPGKHSINIGILPEKASPNYKATFVPGTLEIISKDAPAQYTITVQKGTATPTIATAGEKVKIVADKIPGKIFVGWTAKKGNVTFTAKESETTTFTMPASDVEVVANYKDEISIKKYNIAVTDGTASINEAAEGEIVTITAKDIAGKQFVKWTTTTPNVTFASATNKTTTFEMPASNVDIQAEYEKKDDTTVPENGIKLNHTNLNIRIGNETDLTATILSEDASDKSLTWSVTGNAVELKPVDGQENARKVIAKNIGDAVITVQTSDGKYSASCKVSVYRRTSSGGSSSSSSQNNNTPTKNPDGSQTTVTKNENGATVEVTKMPDGQVETVVKEKDGTIINTQTKPDGTKIETTFKTDGKINANVTVPEKEATHVVTIPDVPQNAGMVAVIVDENGNKQVVKYSYANEDGLVVSLMKNAKLEIYDNSKPFKDVAESAWYGDAVDFVTSHELFFGTKKDKFSPEVSMTRGMFAQVMYRLEDKPTTTNSNAFADVKKSDYFADAVAWASQNDIISGVGNGKFAPNKPITKEELLVMLYRLQTDKENVVTENKTSVNLDNVSPWAVESVNWAVQNGIVAANDGKISNLKSAITRAEVATILWNYVKN